MFLAAFYTHKRLRASAVGSVYKFIHVVMYGCYVIVKIPWVIRKEMARDEKVALFGLSDQSMLVSTCRGPGDSIVCSSFPFCDP